MDTFFIFLTRAVIWKTKKNLKETKKHLQSNGYFTEEESNELQETVYELTKIINMLVDNKYMEELINLKDELNEYTKLKYLNK